MLIDLAQRNLDLNLYKRVCESVYDCLNRSERNSARIFAYILKQLKDVTNMEYKTIVVKSILAPLLSNTQSEHCKEIPDANKQTVEGIVKKCMLLRRLLYTLKK